MKTILVIIIAITIVSLSFPLVVSSDVVPTSMVVISLDDGRNTALDYAHPIAFQYNTPLTHYITPYYVDWSVSYLDWDEINYLYSQGDDIQCHTYSHSHLYGMTEQELRWEFVATNLAFIENGLPEPLHTAYPYGDNDEFIRSIASDYRVSGRTVMVDENSEEPSESSDWLNMKAYALHQLTLSEIEAIIDDAVVNNKAIIFYTHRVYPELLSGGVTTELFEDVCEYIDSVDIEAVTISDCYDRLNPPVIVGSYDEGYDDGYIAGYDVGYNTSYGWGYIAGFSDGEDGILTELSMWIEQQ